MPMHELKSYPNKMANPNVLLPDTAKAFTWREEVDRMRRLKGEKKDFELWRDSLDVKVETQGLPYFFLMPLSDVHIGAVGTDYDSLQKYVTAIKDNPIYTILLGDMGDFFNPKILSHAMMGDVATPDEQMEIIRTFFSEIKDHTLGMVTGNHEKFAENSAGIDPYRWMARDLGIPLLRAGSILTLNVDDQSYRVKVFHKIARYNSSFNYTHAAKQVGRMGDDNIDLVVGGDKHLGAIESTVFKDRVLHASQTGTFKTDDAWGREEGFIPKPQVFFPMHAFDGRRHNIENVRDLDAAVEFVNVFADYSKKKAVAALGMK